jgi:hypothetical protein
MISLLAMIVSRLLVAVAVVVASFVPQLRFEPDLTPPTRLCVREAPEQLPCREPGKVEALLSGPGLRIVAAHETPPGKQGAKRLTLIAESENGSVRLRAKWRAMSTWHGLNDPRRELAAYVLQKQFLEARDFVVPPTVGHCFELAHYRKRVERQQAPSFGKSCVFGILSYWLEDARSIETAYDERLLAGPRLLDAKQFDPTESYRRSLANTNLLNALISAGDTHAAQFVVTGNRRRPRIYSIDHTISFSYFRNPRLGLDDYWSIINVPALPRDSIERLRRLSIEDFEQLSVFEQYQDTAGMLLGTRRTPPGAGDDRGLRWWRSELQVGLTRNEIDLVYNRTQDLLERIDRGEIALF